MTQEETNGYANHKHEDIDLMTSTWLETGASNGLVKFDIKYMNIHQDAEAVQEWKH